MNAISSATGIRGLVSEIDGVLSQLLRKSHNGQTRLQFQISLVSLPGFRYFYNSAPPEAGPDLEPGVDYDM